MKSKLTIKDTDRVVRGGRWTNNATDCRSAFHGWGVLGYRNHLLGFRAVRKAQQ